jgi:hypothetical protein
MFVKSKNAVKNIERHIVILSDGNLSGIMGSELESYNIDKKSSEEENLKKIFAIKKTLLKNKISISSISLKGDNSNIIKELSEIIFWEGNIRKINEERLHESRENILDSVLKGAIVDSQKNEAKLRDTMKLNLKYIQQEQYEGKYNV